MSDRKQVVISSLIWKFLERMGSQGIQFVIQIVLARLLLPEECGIIALIAVFIAVANVFVQSGLNTALIQASKVEEEDYSSVFVVSMLMAIVMYSVLFFSASLIAGFYKIPVLKEVIRVLGLTLFTGALNSVQVAKLSREFQFKQLCVSNMLAGGISGIVGIVVAYCGGGVWALVVQQLGNQLIICIMLAFSIRLKLALSCNLNRIKGFFRFGYKLLLSNLIDVIYNNLYSLVIGKVYSSKDLGYYNRADQFPNVLITNLNGAIQSVMLPALAKEKESLDIVKKMVRRSMVTSSFIICPIMAGLAACAKPIILLLLTEKWIFCADLIPILCFSYAFWPLHTANLQAINALGRSDVFLKLELIKKFLGVVLLIISIPLGIEAMVVSKAIISILSTLINAWPNKKVLNYGFGEQLKDIAPSFSLSIIMGIIVWSLGNMLNLTIIGNLIVQVMAGVIIYIGGAFLFKFECLDYIIDTIVKARKKDRASK